MGRLWERSPLHMPSLRDWSASVREYLNTAPARIASPPLASHAVVVGSLRVGEVPDMETAFLALMEREPRYGPLALSFNQLRRAEYPHLDREGRACLDYGGLGLFSQAQMSVDLEAGTVESKLCETVLEHFQTSAEEYIPVFTASWGAALQILGESYPFSPQTSLLLAYDHSDCQLDAVQRQAVQAGASVHAVPTTWPTMKREGAGIKRLLVQGFPRDSSCPFSRGLLILPLYSRVSGAKASLLWVGEAQRQGWQVLLDVQGMPPGESVDLHHLRPDFLLTSFYKVFGEDPEGMGCILIRRDGMHPSLSPPPAPDNLPPPLSSTSTFASPPHYSERDNSQTFSEASEEALVSEIAPLPPRQLLPALFPPRPCDPPLFEDHLCAASEYEHSPREAGGGSESEEGEGEGAYSRFSSFTRADSHLSAVRYSGERELQCRALEQCRDMGKAAVAKHLEALTAWLLTAFKRLKHPGIEQRALVEMYGPTSACERGATVAFNIVDWKWDRVSPRLVQAVAERQNISVGVGQLVKREVCPVGTEGGHRMRHSTSARVASLARSITDQGLRMAEQGAQLVGQGACGAVAVLTRQLTEVRRSSSVDDVDRREGQRTNGSAASSGEGAASWPVLVRQATETSRIGAFLTRQMTVTKNREKLVRQNSETARPSLRKQRTEVPRNRQSLNAMEEVVVTVDVCVAALGLVSNFEDVYRLWQFVAQFLNPEYLYKETQDFQMAQK